MTPGSRVRLLALASVVAAAVVAWSSGWGHPAWYALPVLAAATAIAETAVVHLSFGTQRWSFSLTEAAIAAGFVYSPGAWAVIAVAAGVAAAQLIRRQEPFKVQFNVAQFSAATAAGAGFAVLAGGGTAAAVAGMGVFWLVNNLLMALAAAALSHEPVRRLLWASAPLAAVHSVGTSGLGVLAAWLTGHAPLGLLALIIPMVLLWVAYDEQTARAAEAALFAELARLQEQASGRSVDVSAHVVMTAAARLFASAEVEMLLMGEDGPVHYAGDENGQTRRRADPEMLNAPWLLRALAGEGVATGSENGRPWCSTVLGGKDAPLAVLVARRAAGAVGFGRQEATLAEVLRKQAESWLSIAELAESRDEALAHAEAAEDAARALGDLGADTVPSLVVLRESANRLARLATVEGPAAVTEIVDELHAVERAVASLLGAIALAAEPDLVRELDRAEPATADRPTHDWTTTGVLSP